MKVRVLEDHVVDRIAAGEVVERPASVLKELLENALDAGATTVRIQLERGGTSLVRVVDDGEGMAKEDALLAIERHATSKIRSDEELESVATLGFRGEALPSIASVSRFTLRTRSADDEVGHALQLEGGKLQGVKQVAMPQGTDIAVRTLFFNTPARRRFLRTVSTELTHCLDLVRREVMMRPEVDVSVRHDGREVLRAIATDDGARRVADLLGPDVRGNLWPLSHEADGIAVRGFVAAPSVHRASAAQAVYTWVGGRAVRDPLLRRAVFDAARARMVSGRYPVVALRVDVPPGDVDVNVHPAKTEVRFRQGRQVSAAVSGALEAAWSGRGRPSPSPPSPDDPAPDLFARPERAPSQIAALPDSARSPRPLLADGASQGPAAAPPAERSIAPEGEPPAEPREMPAPRPVAPAPPPAGAGHAEPARAPEAPAFLVAVEEVGLVRWQGGVWLVDLTAERASDPGPSRPLLVPCAVPLAGPQLEAVLDGAEALEAVGIGVRAFAPGEVAVTSLPEAVDPAQAAALTEAVAEALRRGGDLVAALAPFIATPDPHAAARLAASAVSAGRAIEMSADALRAWIRDGHG